MTLKDVAAEAGVSLMTVSRAMAGHPDVNAQTRQQVRLVAKQMGYRPNAAARMMRSRKTRQIGVLIRNTPDRPMHYPAAYEFILGINEQLETEDYTLTLIRINDVLGAREQTSRIFREHLVDGVIVMDGLPNEVYQRVEALSPKCIWLETNIWRPENCIRRDEIHAGRLASEQLIAMGYRRLIWTGSDQVSDRTHYSTIERLVGVRQAAQAAGVELEIAPLLGWTQPQHPGNVRVAPDPSFLRRILRPDSGTIIESGSAAIHLITAAQAMNLRPGYDFGLVACEVEYSAMIGLASISHVAFNRFDMGKQAADMMLRRLREPDAPCPSVKIRGRWHAGSTAWGPGGYAA